MIQLDGAIRSAFDDGVVTSVVLTGRRLPSPGAVLAAHVAERADVEPDDVELDWTCRQCGSRHGIPAVGYPAGIGARGWHGDAVGRDGLVLAVAGLGPRVGIGLGPEPRRLEASRLEASRLETSRPEASRPEASPPQGLALDRSIAAIEDSAFHRRELDAIAAAPEPLRAEVRAGLWAAKAALVRALGHRAPLEPSSVALVLGGDGEPGRIERPSPDFGADWSRVRIHAVPVPGEVVAAIAVLP